MNKQPDRESIRAMQPGRELDALVEQYVFGNKVRWVQDLITDQYPVSDQEGYIVDYYSTDISAAWEVVEKMSKTCFSEVAMTELDDGAWGWMARFILVLNEPYTVKGYRATAKTAPEAICKAALLAVLEE